MPPFGRAGQTLVSRLLSATRPLTVLCLLHGLIAVAEIPQSGTPRLTTYDVVMARAQQQRKRGDFIEALSGFQAAAELARSSGNLKQQARALNSASGCQIRTFQYRQALESADMARQLALQAGEDSLAGAAASNRATVYSQVGDYVLAAQASRESVSLLQHSSRKDFLATALLNYGDIESQLGNMQDSAATLEQAVTVARAAKKIDVEALAQDHLGEALLDFGDLAGARKALTAARSLRESEHDKDGLALTNANLAELAYREQKFTEALRLLDAVLTSGSHRLSTLHPFWPPLLRGKILSALGRQTQALFALKQAVDSADSWRQDLLPADGTNTRTVVALHEVYQNYIELAADLALKRKEPALASAAFDTLVQNRASSLREEMLSALGQQMRLPPHYFELLASLQTTQAEVTLGQNPEALQENKAKLERIRTELTDLENKIGLQQENSSISVEKVLHRNSLRDIQRSLNGNALLLSFCLGKDRSFLWAISRNDMNLYELPAEEKISAHAGAFTQAVKRGSSTAEGALLTRELFGSLSQRATAKADWLIAADGALLDGVPFGALPLSSQSDTPLANFHAIRFLPSELLLTDRKAPEPQHGFVGIADPIYNLADSRRTRTFSLFSTARAGASITLARLVGSEREVRSAAKLTDLPDVKVLTGSAASSQSLRAALATPPEILHFAVHVVSPQSQNGTADEAALALSLAGNDMPELLTRETIATLRVPGTLVVLSGCSSQQGANLPSAGLIGLSRAWLLAGASAVVVSAWPTPDDSGPFFTSFYKHFQMQSAHSVNIAQRASTALQLTQEDMQHSTGYRKSPAFWAAYSLISKE